MSLLEQFRRLGDSSVTLERVSCPQLSHIRAHTAVILVCLMLGSGTISPAVMAAPEGAAMLCTNSDERLAEASGLVTTPNGYAVVNDGGDQVSVFLLDRECAVSRILTSPQDPFDPEDLARTEDGALWIADIGDNERERETVVIWEVDPSTGSATKHRLAYPDGAHDAEALLIPADKAPVIVTKESSGIAKVYVAPQPLSASATGTRTLRAAGTVTITAAGTSGGPTDAGPTAGVLVTGGAIAPDGKHVALRTYTDAYEWELDSAGDSTASDVATALGSGEPTRTPLPGEPQGESIAYTLDNAGFVTLSEGVGQPLLQWKLARTAGSGKDADGDSSGDDSGWGLGLPDLNRANLMGGIYAGAIIGLLLLVTGIVGIARWRRSRPAVDGPTGSAEDGGAVDGISGRAARQITAVPGVVAPGGSMPQPGVGSRGATYGSGATYGPAAASASVPRVSTLSVPPQRGTSQTKSAGQGTVYGGSAHVSLPPSAVPSTGTTPGGNRGTVYGGRSMPDEPDA